MNNQHILKEWIWANFWGVVLGIVLLIPVNIVSSLTPTSPSDDDVIFQVFTSLIAVAALAWKQQEFLAQRLEIYRNWVWMSLAGWGIGSLVVFLLTYIIDPLLPPISPWYFVIFIFYSGVMGGIVGYFQSITLEKRYPKPMQWVRATILGYAAAMSAVILFLIVASVPLFGIFGLIIAGILALVIYGYFTGRVLEQMADTPVRPPTPQLPVGGHA